jgi:hypothetical protein
MARILIATCRRMVFKLTSKSGAGVCSVSAVAIAIALAVTPIYAVGIQGTMSNFDVFNETSINVYGAEIDLEGVHPAEVAKTYPSHFNIMTATEYTTGTTFGTHLTFKGYNFDPSGYMIPRVGQSTNGHFAVNLPGCEHFGFSVQKQPSATRFFWLDQSYAQLGTTPMSIPNAAWTYVPPAGGGLAAIQAVVVPPPPEIPEIMLPDSIWMKVFVTELDRPVDLEELISGPGTVVPQGVPETEWSLLEGGVPEMAEVSISDLAQSVIRRYEYYKYTGNYDPTDHAPLSTWDHLSPPPGAELGDFIAANMVAANLVDVPEPSGLALILTGLGMSGWMARRRRNWQCRPQ